ncbi:MAG: hypothetical protein D6732_03550, partial [Methanobacteriota archaeon]
GSYSIKKVLPALLPELSYAEMEIGDGMAAANAYLAMREGLPEEKVAALRKNLLDYCRLDTLAMVRLLEKLRELVGRGKNVRKM